MAAAARDADAEGRGRPGQDPPGPREKGGPCPCPVRPGDAASGKAVPRRGVSFQTAGLAAGPSGPALCRARDCREGPRGRRVAPSCGLYGTVFFKALPADGPVPDAAAMIMEEPCPAKKLS